MTSEPQRLHDEPTENHKALASGQLFPQSGEKKKWITPTVKVEKFVLTEARPGAAIDGALLAGSTPR